MNVPFEFHVALRYLLAKRKQAFISVISSISTLGVTVGVMALVIALALMTGLQREMRDRIVGGNPHVYVWNTNGIADYRAEVEKLHQVAHVIGAAPAILGQGLVSASRDTAPLMIKGIDPELELQVTDIKRAMQSGTVESLEKAVDPAAGDAAITMERDGILLGSELATKLGVRVGDTVSVLTPQEVLTPNGLTLRPARLLRVAGTFSLGLYEFDSAYGYVSIAVAKRLLGKDQVDLVQLRVDDLALAPEVAATILQKFGSQYLAEDWTVMNRALFSALSVEKMAISLTIGLIVMVAALNIVASLVLLVMEKHRDIAILKTMGASARSVMTIFMMQGLIIGIVGTAVGAAAGYIVAYVLDRYRLVRIPVDVYQVSYVPFRVLPSDFMLVIAGAILICFVATLYPSRQAARLDPAQSLRYE
ncbi:MAG TPA: ABC transporter permease [Vicinamibacterales bacterium]|nr:ABC transporter permease [Vicinamibacterales bacterium]